MLALLGSIYFSRFRVSNRSIEKYFVHSPCVAAERYFWFITYTAGWLGTSICT